MSFTFEAAWKEASTLIEGWITFPSPFEVLEIPIEMAMKAVAYIFLLFMVPTANYFETFLGTIATNLTKVAPSAIQGLKDFINDPLGTIKTGFGSVVGGVTGFISDETGPLKTWIDGAGSWVWSQITDAKIGFPNMLSGLKVDLFGWLGPAFDSVPKTIAAWFEPKLAEGLETLNVVLKRELGLTKEAA